LAFGKVVSPPVVGSFAAQAPAREAGLRVGDRIVAVDGNPIAQFPDIVELVVPYPGRTVAVTVQRGAEQRVIPVRLLTFVERDRFGN
ncbi:PDZ domain-containing protein, partial [Acinetobacter baumannii]